MAMCHVLSTRSEDPSTKHGAIVVAADKTVVSVGINGTVRGVVAPPGALMSREPGGKYDWMLHAEDNCICHVENTLRLVGATIYITGRPCSQCAMRAMQHGVKRIVYGSRKSHCIHGSPKEAASWKAVQSVAQQKGVSIEDFTTSGKPLCLSFSTEGVREMAHYGKRGAAPSKPFH